MVIKYLFMVVPILFGVFFISKMNYHYGKWRDNEREGKPFQIEKKRYYNHLLGLLASIVFLLAIILLIEEDDKVKINYVFNEEFTDASPPWDDEIIKEKSESKVFDGRLFLKSKNEKTQSRNEFVSSFDASKDYIIESSLKFGKGKVDEFYGIDWGMDDEGIYFYNFGISPEKKVQVYKYTQSEGKEILLSKSNFSSIKSEKYNQLSILKRNGAIDFMVNSKLVGTVDNIEEFGKKIGVMTPSFSEIVVDFLRMGYVEIEKKE